MIHMIDRNGTVHIDFHGAMPDGPKAGYYADEVHVFAGELMRRRLAAA